MTELPERLSYHFYESPDGLRHKCEGSELVNSTPATYTVWTFCEIDVPVGADFVDLHKQATCPKCLYPTPEENT